MQKTIVNKMTFYDVVTLIVPSAWLSYAFHWTTLSEATSNNWITYIALFGWLLILGLILKNIAMFWNSMWFRNNTDIICEEIRNIDNPNEKSFICKFVQLFILDPINIFIKPFTAHKSYRQNQQLLKEYYNAYDSAYRDEYYGKRIEILESHAAFVQTWSFALIISIFGCYGECCFCHCCCLLEPSIKLKFIISACFYLCLAVLSIIQRKIYNLVWDSRKYINKEKEEKSLTNNNNRVDL